MWLVRMCVDSTVFNTDKVLSFRPFCPGAQTHKIGAANAQEVLQTS
jgi:hypothetical protein